jgi:DNA-binding MarR family transcriptional regulator
MTPEQIIFLIARVRERANRFIMQELKSHHLDGLAPSHGAILSALFQRSPLSMRVLARIIDRDKSTMTALVDKLATLGYVEKVKDETDQRVTLVTLTPKAHAIRPELEDVSKKLLATVYKGISAGEKQILVEILTKIQNNL